MNIWHRLHWISATFCSLLLASCFWWWVGKAAPIADLPGVATGERLQCVSYAPYRRGESPQLIAKDFEFAAVRLDEDLSLLAKYFDCIRIYSVAAMDNLPAVARAHHLKILLGAWVNHDALDTQIEIDHAIRFARANPDVIRAVIVGNEALLRKEVTPAQLIAYLHTVRAALPGVPITYADVWEFWLANREVAPAVDFVTMHILPYWENRPRSVRHGMIHLEYVYAKIESAFPGKNILIGETGWPSEGRPRRNAAPSLRAQATYIRDFLALATQRGWQYNLIEAFDQPWKRGNEGMVGGYWGLFDTDRHDKHMLAGDVSNFPEWRFDLAFCALCIFLLMWMGARDPQRNQRPAWQLVLPSVLCSLALTFHARQSWFGVRAPPEGMWAASIFALAFFSSAALLHDWKQYRRWCVLATVLSVAVTALELVFDARYRSIPLAGFIVPIMFSTWVGWRNENSLSVPLTPPSPQRERVNRLGDLLCVAGVCLLIIERPSNVMADAWIACVLIFGYTLRARTHAVWTGWRWRILSCFAAYGIASAIRHGLMESVSLVERCSIAPDFAWCTIRDTIGMAIYFQIFSRSAFVLLTLALITRRQIFAISALPFAIVGLVLYNVTPSAIALVWALMMIA